MACVPPQVSDGVLRCVHWLNYTTFRLPLYYQSSTSRNVTLTVTAPAASGALARSPRGRCSPSGRQTRRFRGSVTRDSATYRDPCAKTGSGMYTATRPYRMDGRGTSGELGWRNFKIGERTALAANNRRCLRAISLQDCEPHRPLARTTAVRGRLRSRRRRRNARKGTVRAADTVGSPAARLSDGTRVGVSRERNTRLKSGRSCGFEKRVRARDGHRRPPPGVRDRRRARDRSQRSGGYPELRGQGEIPSRVSARPARAGSSSPRGPRFAATFSHPRSENSPRRVPIARSRAASTDPSRSRTCPVTDVSRPD